MVRNNLLHLHHAPWHQQKTILSSKMSYHCVWHQEISSASVWSPLCHPVRPQATESARIQRWSLLLGSYDYTIEYKQGDHHANADCLSQLPLPTAPSNIPVPPETVHLIGPSRFFTCDISPNQAVDCQGSCFVKGFWSCAIWWPPRQSHSFSLPQVLERVVSTILPFIVRKLSHHSNRMQTCSDGAVAQRSPGKQPDKGLAHSFVWWPGIDKAIEQCIKSCEAYQSIRHSSSSSLGIPRHTVEQIACQLCWAVPWEDITHCHQCPFEVARGETSLSRCHCHWAFSIDVCYTRVA